MSNHMSFCLPTRGRIVLKIGSALLVDEVSGVINQKWLTHLCQDIAALRAKGFVVILVSSGAVGVGRKVLNLGRISLSLVQKQACAAVGQALLIEAYQKAFTIHDIQVAQALFSPADTENRRRFINGRATLSTLLDVGVVPIINENDTVATAEIRYGDNDRLAARIAQMLEADILILLSDIDGVYDKDPHLHPDALLYEHIADFNENIMSLGEFTSKSSKQKWGMGGIATKLQAAKIASQTGCMAVITKGDMQSLLGLWSSDNPRKASIFAPQNTQCAARKQWISASLAPKGIVYIDEGAGLALQAGKSLLCVGVRAIEGNFDKGDTVVVKTGEGARARLIAHGLVSYNSQQIGQIKGLQSQDIENVLGYNGGTSFIHCDNMVVSD